MIHLMTPAGTGADRPETVRGAKLMSGESALSGKAEQLGMRDILAMLDTLHGVQGEPREPLYERAGEAHDASETEQPRLRDAAAMLETHEMHGESGEQLIAGHGEAQADFLQAQPNISRAGRLPEFGAHAAVAAMTGLDRASFGVAQSPDGRASDLPLQQIEQWLGELQDLRRRHAAPGEQHDEEPLVGVSGAPEPMRGTLHQDSIRMQAQWANLAEPRGLNMPIEQDVFTGTRLATAAVTVDAALLAGVMDEPALQAAISRTTDSLTSVHPGTPIQQVTGQAPISAEIRLQGPEARWGEQMLQALRDQVEMQLAQRSQHATIRLDPPDLGTLDIQINHEQGKLSIQINAGQADVARLLNMLSERLRHELLGQNFAEVNVQIGGNTDQGREGRQRHPNDAGTESVAAARVFEPARSGTNRDPAGDVLISV